MPPFITHLLCDDCWKARCARLNQVGREPYRSMTSQTELCCKCSKYTASGIKVPNDVEFVNCRHVKHVTGLA